MASFLGEIKRRKVFQVAAVYLVVAWLVVQVVDVVNEPLSLPDWFDTVAILILAIGFPIAVISSWAFDLTPQGVVRDQGPNVAAQRGGRRIEYVLIGLLVLAVGWIGWREFNPPGPSSIGVLPNSVAVLPFENLSLDPENAFFAAGIHDTILNELAKIADINVIARTSVLPYGDGQTPIARIAEALRVEAVMEGTVQYAEGRVLVTAQLIDPEMNVHLWSESYDREFAGVFELQADIAKRIAMALEVELVPEEQQRIERAATQVPEAYAAYLRARALIPEISPLAPPDFYGHLDEAITLDPQFALAHATKAFAYSVRINAGFLGPLGESLDVMQALVRQHADQAITIDSRQGLAYAARAMLDQQFFREDAARANFNRALEYSPNDADILDNLVRFNLASGRYEEAVRDTARIGELNPAGMLGLQPDVSLFLGNYDAASAEAQIALGVYGRGPWISAWAALINAAAGDTELATENLRTAEAGLSAVPDPQILAALVAGYGQIGQREFAERLLGQLEELYEVGPASSDQYPFWAAAWSYAYSGIGDREQALLWLNRLASTRDPSASVYWTAILTANAFAFPLLDEPEFEEVRSRLGFGL